MNRQTLTKIHMLLAAFMFPVALMYLVTGGFYTWGIKGSYNDTDYDIALAEPLPDQLPALLTLVETELESRSVEPPSGGAKIKRAGTSFQLEWTGAARDVVLEPTDDPRVARLTVKETTWYRNFVQLHKAKGGQLFKVYAAMLASALFVILASGFLMAWQVPKYRQSALRYAATGALLFVIMVAVN